MSKRRKGVGGSGRRCVAPRCGRFVKVGKALCRRHRRGQEGRDLEEAVRRVSGEVEQAFGGARNEESERRREAAERFRQGLERGAYRELFDGRLGEVMAQAAEERGLADEIGALRVVMARLLAEEQDASKLALSVARVTQASARVAREHRAIVGEPRSELQETLTEVLAELGEQEMRARELGSPSQADHWREEVDRYWDLIPLSANVDS